MPTSQAQPWAAAAIAGHESWPNRQVPKYTELNIYHSSEVPYVMFPKLNICLWTK